MIELFPGADAFVYTIYYIHITLYSTYFIHTFIAFYCSVEILPCEMHEKKMGMNGTFYFGMHCASVHKYFVAADLPFRLHSSPFSPFLFSCDI